MDIKVLPSIMVCKVEEYKPYMELFEKVGLDAIHFDIMDGYYVRNVMLGTKTYWDIKRLSNLPVDVHIMAIDADTYFDLFDWQEGDRVSFHPETSKQPYRLLRAIKEKGCQAGLVFTLGTPLSYLEENINQVDYVTLMTINLGFQGQSMAPDALDKIKRTRELLDKYGKHDVPIVVDGSTTWENAPKMKEAGATSFIVGTSSIIKGLDTFEEDYNKYVEMLSK